VSAEGEERAFVPGRKYLALLSHSGSRGVGFKIANRYSGMAKEKHPKLDRRFADLSWLDLDSEEGEEYWVSMNLAGRFASANHAVIHEKVARALAEDALATVENHHNFAWREEVDGREAIVHRKGATPAGAGVLGVIPGSMGDPGYVVRGRGNSASLNSASHGAGRLMSRTGALASIPESDWRGYLEEKGVTLIGGSLDEAPQAYKSIERVVAMQGDLVDLVGRFSPRIVRMDAAGAPRRTKKGRPKGPSAAAAVSTTGGPPLGAGSPTFVRCLKGIGTGLRSSRKVPLQPPDLPGRWAFRKAGTSSPGSGLAKR